ncbi:P-loop containing nucleoside triphosphate hydrolase protein [Mycena alexandri]|uniref:P-loop containing nucleoside triphosphate hydrolase protein n=1 Tax=Mycena alexandri TaxID=1745969 RepID=A0AAD6TDK7_9AGAR|nr:P-loop containing nucleoside triphosphate hydrolase protein [Mycena alexandri]
MLDSPADDFINIWTSVDNDFHRHWNDLGSGKFVSPPLQALNAIRKIYPNHSVVGTFEDVVKYPDVLAAPLPDAPHISVMNYVPQRRVNGRPQGALREQIHFAAFTVAWEDHDFIVYVGTYPTGFGLTSLFLILHDGPEDPAQALVLKTGLWADTLHEEIWTYNMYWRKDHQLWVDIQSADWDDVILKDDFKNALHKDIYGFFKSEPIYKRLAIPWKRGIIMYGPPGNGKTISIKVIMKTCDAQGFTPLYVKSFQHFYGEEYAMAEVFEKARQLAPCVMVLEDLDALITDRNRSFFLNQLDGLQGNDGLLVIGTTNHFERLDPGLSTRPSRFDRKYLFDDPDLEERKLYAQYWQNKLKPNEEIEFPDALVNEIAEQTDKFSFAYLKEVFVSALVTLAGWEGDDKPTFNRALKDQIKLLRKQLDNATLLSLGGSNTADEATSQHSFRPLFDTFPSSADGPFPLASAVEGEREGKRGFRALFDRLQLGQNTPEMLAQFEARLAETRRMLGASGQLD